MIDGGRGRRRRWQTMRFWVLGVLAGTLLVGKMEANTLRLRIGNVQDIASDEHQNLVGHSPLVLGNEEEVGQDDFNSDTESGWALRTLTSLIIGIKSRFPVFGKGADLTEEGFTEDFASTFDAFQTSELPVSTTFETSTTTLDPMEAYCEVACEQGIAGPECDCPGHPVG